MRKDLGLVGQEYSWATSMFYFGYLVAQVCDLCNSRAEVKLTFKAPSSYLLTKFPIGKYASFNVFLWGIMVLLCACAKNFAGLAVLRFFMGVFESAIGPCWVTMMSIFYKNGEQGSRVT